MTENGMDEDNLALYFRTNLQIPYTSIMSLTEERIIALQHKYVCFYRTSPFLVFRLEDVKEIRLVETYGIWKDI